MGDPDPGRVGGDPGDAHTATLVFDHDEDVEAAQEEGVDVGEVDCEDRVGLGGQELLPGRAGPSWRGIESRVRAELDRFIGAVETGTQPEPNFADGRATLALADAAGESLRSGPPYT